MRFEEEFYCDVNGGGCGKYFKTHLRTNMFGNYTIECPGCQHHHFRVIESGVVTKDRHNERMGQTEIILSMKATLSDTPWHNDPAFKRQRMRAIPDA